MAKLAELSAKLDVIISIISLPQPAHRNEITEAMKQQQILKPRSPYQQESPVTDHSAKLSASE